MKTIKERVINSIEIKNSKFITVLIPLKENKIDNIIEEIKIEYPKATHYCYAYIWDNEKNSSDDKEPSHTAGLPMLNVLEKEQLNHLLAITIRYFGGIKLGAGGLVRAYTKSITEALKEAKTIELIEGYKVKIIISYKDEKQLNYLLLNKDILEREYKEDIIYKVLVEKEDLNKLSNYNVEILEELYIEKRIN